MLANEPPNFQKDIVWVAWVKLEMGKKGFYLKVWMANAHQSHGRTYTLFQCSQKKLLFESSYGENTLIIYLKYKSFESNGSLTSENTS